MANTMPTPDSALKEFFKDNEIFAALFNGYFFDNKPVVKADELETEDSAYATTVKNNNKGKRKYKTEKINKYRDNVRRTSLGYFVILGIEDQDQIHYSMPVRKMLYDVLGYSKELSALQKVQDKDGWTVDEWLSKVKKGTKVTPIITVVFYTGEEPWDGPKSLHDMMDIDDNIKAYVPDYPLYVIDMGHDGELTFNNKELDDLKNVLSSLYSGAANENESIVDNSIIALTGILAGDEKLYFSAVESRGGKQKVCRALQERDEKIIKAKEAEFASKLEEMNALFASEREAMNALVASERNEMNALMAEKDAEIIELRKQLAAIKN